MKIRIWQSTWGGDIDMKIRGKAQDKSNFWKRNIYNVWHQMGHMLSWATKSIAGQYCMLEKYLSEK